MCCLCFCWVGATEGSIISGSLCRCPLCMCLSLGYVLKSTNGWTCKGESRSCIPQLRQRPMVPGHKAGLRNGTRPEWLDKVVLLIHHSLCKLWRKSFCTVSWKQSFGIFVLEVEMLFLFQGSIRHCSRPEDIIRTYRIHVKLSLTPAENKSKLHSTDQADLLIWVWKQCNYISVAAA